LLNFLPLNIVKLNPLHPDPDSPRARRVRYSVRRFTSNFKAARATYRFYVSNILLGDAQRERILSVTICPDPTDLHSVYSVVEILAFDLIVVVHARRLRCFPATGSCSCSGVSTGTPFRPSTKAKWDPLRDDESYPAFQRTSLCREHTEAVSPSSHLHLTFISPSSHLDLTFISPSSHLHLTFISP